ncbi:histidine kinase, partial [candidate division KSB1 bacterium]|nr:histidine kinase [candidate division KSB1 bacterium]
MPLFSRKYFSLIFIFFLNSYSYSQRSDIKFERISINEGLSQNNVTSIVQDRRGFMWFGTLDGLNKFDGYTFKVYKHLPSEPNSLSANTISTIFADKSDNLWIGTMAAGLNKLNFRTEQFTRYQHEPDNEQSISGNRVRAILEDRSGNLWIGTRDGGLNVLEGATGTFYNFKNDKHSNNIRNQH